MNYNFEVDKWYFINENSHGFLSKKQFLGTIKTVEFFDSENEYLDKLNQLGIKPENENNI